MRVGAAAQQSREVRAAARRRLLGAFEFRASEAGSSPRRCVGMSDAADDTSCSDGSDEVSGAELVVKQKAGELVNEFDRYLDPFELFHSPSNSNPPRVNL